jgi:hypothetical protein
LSRLSSPFSALDRLSLPTGSQPLTFLHKNEQRGRIQARLNQPQG